MAQSLDYSYIHNHNQVKKTSHAGKQNKQSKKSGVSKTGMAVGAATLIAAAAGAYFLYGTEKGAKTRKQIKSWSLKAKGEVLEQLEGLTEVSEEAYAGIVKKVAAGYQKAKKLDPSDVADFVSEMTGYWKHLGK